MDDAPEGGFYQAPTLLRDVPVNHRLAQEEVFGPVLSSMAFDSEEQAIEMANATEFGLVAGVWTRGHGREKGFEALYGFTVLKTVAIRHG